jgi:hypothetical protein
MAGSVRAALWIAVAAFVIAVGLEIAYGQKLQAIQKMYEFCVYGGRDSGGFLSVAGPAALLLGGIASLSLVTMRRSRGSRRRRSAAFVAAAMLALALLFLAYNSFAAFATFAWCGG